jgi:hypothetical protein
LAVHLLCSSSFTLAAATLPVAPPSSRGIAHEVLPRDMLLLLLLVPDRIWVNTAHVISIFSNEKTLLNVFYAVRLSGAETARRITKHYAAVVEFYFRTFADTQQQS